jgi:hypothetical protein
VATTTKAAKAICQNSLNSPKSNPFNHSSNPAKFSQEIAQNSGQAII